MPSPPQAEAWTPVATTERQSLQRGEPAQRAASETSATHWLGYTNKACLRVTCRRQGRLRLCSHTLIGYEENIHENQLLTE